MASCHQLISTSATVLWLGSSLCSRFKTTEVVAPLEWSLSPALALELGVVGTAVGESHFLGCPAVRDL